MGHQNKPIHSNCILCVPNTMLILTSTIHNFQIIRLSLVLKGLVKRVANGWIVRVYKMLFHKLHTDRTLPNCWESHNDQLSMFGLHRLNKKAKNERKKKKKTWLDPLQTRQTEKVTPAKVNDYDPM